MNYEEIKIKINLRDKLVEEKETWRREGNRLSALVRKLDEVIAKTPGEAAHYLLDYQNLIEKQKIEARSKKNDLAAQIRDLDSLITSDELAIVEEQDKVNQIWEFQSHPNTMVG